MAYGGIVAAIIEGASALYGAWSGERGHKQSDKSRRLQRYLTGVAYQKNMNTWNRNKQLAAKWAKHWKDVGENPGKMNPYFSSFKEDVEKAAEGTRGRIADALRRAGRGAGSGEYDKAMQEIEATSEKSLIKTLAEIRQDAKRKEQQAEQGVGPEPFLGMTGSVPSLGDQNFNPGNYTPKMPDFSGIGEALAYLGKTKTPGDSDSNNDSNNDWESLWNELDYPTDDFTIME